jgi:hypothetical protein
MLFFICFFAKIETEKKEIAYFKWKGKISVLKGRNEVLNCFLVSKQGMMNLLCGSGEWGKPGCKPN